jgi:ABC-type multidrug transport system ATPase subunit
VVAAAARHRSSWPALSSFVELSFTFLRMACLGKGKFGEMETEKKATPTTNTTTRSKIVCCCSGECTGVTIAGSKDSGRLYPYIKASQVAGGLPSPSPSPSRSTSYEIEVRNLSYKIVKIEGTPKKGMLQSVKAEVARYRSKPSHYVLKHVTCTARPGEVLAVAGPSGAGKSTLLEVLAGRIQPSSPSSSILVNGLPMDMQKFRRISGYVMQDDALFPVLTVRETLLYSARLRLPSSVPMKEKEIRVKALMNELGLSHVANTRIGNETIRGVSGGERRRVSIGVDVIHDPAVLILDEPTSGLDSAAALHVVAMLRTMAVSHNRTIILSIHQPGYRILQLIHSVVLLARGSVVHNGPLELLSSRLAAAGHIVPPQVNVLEYAIDAVDSLNSDESGIIFPTTNVVGKQQGNSNTLQQQKSDSSVTFANSNATEVMVLAHRFAINIIRSRQLLIARTVQGIAAGLGLGSIFIKMGYGTRGATERAGFLAFTLTFLLTSSIEALPIFLEESHILARETSRGAYRVWSYVVANTIVFFPFLFFLATLFTVPVYWLVGLSSNYHAFLFFLLAVWITLIAANSFIAFFSSLVTDFILGNSLVTGFMGAFFLFSGYFISKENMPKYWLVMHYTSLFKYPLDALLINEYTHIKAHECFGPVYVDKCFLTGPDILLELGLNKENKWVNLCIMVGFAIAYRLLCYAVLRFKLLRRRR